MPIKPKYGTGFKFGNGWKFGYGTSEPWSPLATPATVDRFNIESLEDPDPSYLSLDAFPRLLSVSDSGLVTVTTDGGADEVFYLSSPNGTPWRITINATTGLVTMDSGLTGSPLLSAMRGRWRLVVDDAGILSVRDDTGELYTIETNHTPTYTVETQ